MEPLIPYFPPVRYQIADGWFIEGAGTMVVVGFVLGGWVAVNRARREGLSSDTILVSIALIIVGTVVGGHLGYQLLYEPLNMLRDPFSMLRFWDGQLSFGGFVTCIALSVWYLRHESVGFARQSDRVWTYCDCLVKGLAIGQLAGRIGCFIVHDHPGVETEFWLGVYGTCPGGTVMQACHDVGLYEALLMLGIFGYFLLADRQPRFPGYLVAMMLVTYGLGRFGLDFLRHPLTETRYLGLTGAQYGCLAFLIWGTAVLYKRRKIPPPIF